MSLDRTAFNALVDERLAPGLGTTFGKAEIATALLDPIDARWSRVTITAVGTQNNLVITEADLVIFNNATDLTVTGMVAPASPAKPGKPLRYLCIGAGNVYFAHEAAGSTAANRLRNILTSGNTPHAGGSGSGLLVYDDVTARWRLVAHEQGAWLSWTPAWLGSGGQTGQVYGAQTGRYLVRGRTIDVTARLTLTTLGTITTIVQIGGLPFPVAAAYYGLTVDFFTALTATVVSLFGFIPPSGSIMVPQKLAAAGTGGANLAQADLSNTTDLVVSGRYETT